VENRKTVLRKIDKRMAGWAAFVCVIGVHTTRRRRHVFAILPATLCPCQAENESCLQVENHIMAAAAFFVCLVRMSHWKKWLQLLHGQRYPTEKSKKMVPN
jgi:hypothetical protein